MNMDKIKEIKAALIDQNLYNPYDVFQHSPDFYKSNDERYDCIVECVKWNTRSTRVSVYYARFDKVKNRWVFARSRGQKRTPHGEKMR